MNDHLNLQVCVYPRFDGGIYFTVGQGPLNRMVRLSLGFIDFRVWLVKGFGPARYNSVPMSGGNPEVE